jgi:dihydroorotate dehydrogenase
MTPNITDIKVPARAALAAGMEGIAAINTIQSVIGVLLLPRANIIMCTLL